MLHNSDIWLAIATLVPLLVVALVLTPLGRNPRHAAILAIGGYSTSLGLALWTVARKLLARGHMGQMGHLGAAKPILWTWLTIHTSAAAREYPNSLRMGVAVDSLTLVTFLLTALIALLVGIYVIGIVDDRRIRPGWFAWSNLFVFGMFSMVVAASVLELFAAGVLATVGIWGMAGAAWRGPCEASVRRMIPLPLMGDAFFLLGICLLLVHCNPAVLALPQVNGVAPIMASLGVALHASGVVGVLQSDGPSRLMGLGWWDWSGILMVLGIAGKAAQFPLHTWAVETTPAATPTGALTAGLLIAVAGPYLTARLIPLLNVDVRLLAAMAAAATLCFGALCSLTASDIKRGLMWLVSAQAGLSILFLVTGSYVAGLYESIYLALSGTCLFICAGTVLHCTGGESDFRRLGGLWRSLPVTAAASLLVCSAAMGLLLFGQPNMLVAGFENLRHIGAQIGEYGNLLYWLPLVACYLILFGLARWWWLIFGGAWRGTGAAPGGESAVRLFPLVLLALGSLMCGQPLLGISGLLAKSRPDLLFPPYTTGAHSVFAVQMANRLAWAWPMAIAVVVAIYSNGLGRAEKIRRLPGPNLIYRWLDAELYFYDLYGAVSRVIISGLAAVLGAADRWVIGWLVVSIGLIVRLISIVFATLDWRLTSVVASGGGLLSPAGGNFRAPVKWRWFFPLAIFFILAAAALLILLLAVSYT